MSGALCRSGVSNRFRTSERALCCNCFAVGACIERFHGGGGKRENECGDGRVVLRRRGIREVKQEKEEAKEKKRGGGGKKEKSGKQRPTLSAGTDRVGEGAFSDEIRSRGRSEFGYLIRSKEGGGGERRG